MPGAAHCATCQGPAGPAGDHLDDPLAGPDLDLDGLGALLAPSERRGAHGPESAWSAEGDSSFHDMDDPLAPARDLPDGLLEPLPVSAPARSKALPSYALRGRPLAGPPDGVVPLGTPGMAAPSDPGAAAPPGAIVDPAQPSTDPAPDPFEVLAFADYGPVPTGLFGSIPYAFHVGRRQLSLRAGRNEATVLGSQAEALALEALAALGWALLAHRDELDGGGGLAPLFAAATTAETEWKQRSAARAQAADEQREELAHLRTARISLEQAAAPFRDRETRLQTQLEQRRTDLRRAQARLSRTDIQLRNLTQANLAPRTEPTTGNGGPSAAAPPATVPPVAFSTDPVVAGLWADREARHAEVALTAGRVEETEQELLGIRRELAARLGQVGSMERSERLATAVHTGRLGARETGLVQAEWERRVVLAALGEKALAEGVADVEAKAADAARHAAARLAARRRDQRLYAAAVAAFDRQAVTRAAVLVGGAAGLILLTLAFVILR